MLLAIVTVSDKTLSKSKLHAKNFKFITKETFIDQIKQSKINDFKTQIYLVSIETNEGLIPFKTLTTDYLEKEFFNEKTNNKVISFLNRISDKKLFKK